MTLPSISIKQIIFTILTMLLTVFERASSNAAATRTIKFSTDPEVEVKIGLCLRLVDLDPQAHPYATLCPPSPLGVLYHPPRS